jgi:hypothetical protein
MLDAWGAGRAQGPMVAAGTPRRRGPAGSICAHPGGVAARPAAGRVSLEMYRKIGAGAYDGRRCP